MSRVRFVTMAMLALGALGDLRTVKTLEGKDSQVRISTQSSPVKWVQIVGDKGNHGPVWVGDGSVAKGNGLPVDPGGWYLTPTGQGITYDLSRTFVWLGVGDKAYVAFGN